MISTRLIAFYIALLVGYSITAPGYMFLSNSTEKIDETGSMEGEGFEIEMLVDDLIEGLKIAGMGIVTAFFLFFITFVPVFGIIVAFIVLMFYSTLMFIDFPTSKRHWTLSQKFEWIYRHPMVAARLGFIPALIGLIPVFNVLFIAFLFPIFTIHTTRNFRLILENEKNETEDAKE
jgi:CysZ protein